MISNKRAGLLRKSWVTALTFSGCMVLSPAHSADLFDSFQAHGFASQGFILTSENNFFGDSSHGGSFDFRELGLNASLRPLPRLQLSAQGIYRDAGAGDESTLRLDYGLADFSLISNETNRLGVRLGRIKAPFGLYNDTRDVAFTRPSILLPQSIYFDRSRNLALSGDGGEIYGEHRAAFGDLSFQFAAGQAALQDADKELEELVLARDFPGKLEADTSYIGRAIYEYDNARIRLALSNVRLNLEYSPGVQPPFDLLPFALNFDTNVVSAQYNAEKWSLTSEYAFPQTRLDNLGAFPNSGFTGESYYLQGTWRVHPKWEGLLRFDAYYLDKDDRSGREFAASTGLPAHAAFARDWTVGLSWNISSSVLLRGEYHRVDGTGWLPQLDNPNLLDTERRWDLFSILASYRF